MSALDPYWAGLNAQLDAIAAGPQTADHVIEVLQPPSSGDGFFAGGMDRDLEGVLMEAGWKHVWAEASYYWGMLPPGETDHAKGIHYVEGDVYRGVGKPLPDDD